MSHNTKNNKNEVNDSTYAESGETADKEHASKDINPTLTTVNRKNKRANLTTIALIILASLTTFNTITTLALTTPGITQFPGASLFNISAQYQYGPSPNGAVLLPGDNVNFTLTIQNSAHHATDLRIFFNATNPDSWTCTCNIQLVQGIYTMTIGGQSPVAPINKQADITSATVSIVPGINQIRGTITASPIRDGDRQA